MANKKPSIILYTDVLQHIEQLSCEEAGTVFLGILRYSSGLEIPEMTPTSKMCFSFIRAQIDRDAGKWTDTIDKRREAGRLGGLAKAHNNAENLANLASAKNAKQNLAKPSKTKQTLANVADTVTDTDTVTVNNISTEIENGKERNSPTESKERKPKGDLDVAVDFFKEHRKKIKKPMTDHAVDLFRRKLEKLAPNDPSKQIELIDHAIGKGWQDVYLPDEWGNQTSKTPEPKKTPKPRTFVLTEDGGLKYDDEP